MFPAVDTGVVALQTPVAALLKAGTGGSWTLSSGDLSLALDAGEGTWTRAIALVSVGDTGEASVMTASPL